MTVKHTILTCKLLTILYFIISKHLCCYFRVGFCLNGCGMVAGDSPKVDILEETFLFCLLGVLLGDFEPLLETFA